MCVYDENEYMACMIYYWHQVDIFLNSNGVIQSGLYPTSVTKVYIPNSKLLKFSPS